MQSNYNPLFAKWTEWYHQWDRDPFVGPVEDIINFLANLFEKGYQYRSLNAYQSAISSVHAEVDGQPVGQHPLITRLLKGAFNERPPLPRYSTFWDIGVVLRYLKLLGTNEALTLCSLALKATILLALTRSSRSVGLRKLDIRSQSLTAEGMLFEPQHLLKQSRPSKPLADFFYPRFPDEPLICLVVTIQAYEKRTQEFCVPASNKDTRKTALLLSWVGKHDPVSSSTIARWLNACL